MVYGKNGKKRNPNKKKGKTKRDRSDHEATKNRQDRTDKKRGGNGLPLREREDNGYLELTEEMIRTYIAVSYITRFDEPCKEEWPECISILHDELPTTKTTIKSIFVKLASDRVTVSEATKRKGSGRKRKLTPDNPGLRAAAVALNSGVSQSMATEICNQQNKRLRPNDYVPVSRPTMMGACRAFADVKVQAVLRRKSGSRDKNSPWAKARVASSKMILEQCKLGEKLEAGTTSMADCKALDLPPMYEDAVAYCDQSHMKAVPAGGMGQQGSTGKRQVRISLDPTTGDLKPMADGGQMPRRRQQVTVKYDKESRGCYTIAMPTINGEEKPQWLKTFNYTERKMESANNSAKYEKAEIDRVKKAAGNDWHRYNSDNPYKERYGMGGIVIPEDAPEWKKQWLVTQTAWYQKMYDNSGGLLKKKSSIKHFVLFLINECEELWKNTNRKDHWVIWHDRLSILWDKSTQAWLRTLPCPVEGWPDRTYADRFVRIRGKYNDDVTPYYQDSMMGDSPERSPEDCHLFGDVKVGVSRNVAFSFFLPDDDPDKYSLTTPHKVFESIERTIRRGCPSDPRMLEDMKRIRKSTLQRMIDAEGEYIDDSSRNGVRDAAQRAHKEAEEEAAAAKKNPVDSRVIEKFNKMCDDMNKGKGLPLKYQPVVEEVEVVESRVEEEQDSST